MADENRKKNSSIRESVLEKLEASPFGHDFFKALRDLENHFKNFPRIGRSLSPREDAIRLGQKVELAFPTSTIEGMQPGTAHRPAKVVVRFFGLLGPNGPLPINFTEYAYERLHNFRDFALSAFYDVFHHRLISLFYRAWAINQKAVDLDRPEESRFPVYIGSVFGAADPSQCSRDAIPDHAKLYYSGILSSHARGCSGLKNILADFFETAVDLEPMVGHWLPISSRYHCELGRYPENATLGVNAIIGERIWDVQNRFHLRLGPMSYERFVRFLPGGDSYKRLVDWVAFYTNTQLNWSANIVLATGGVPPTTLGGGTRLGWTSWLLADNPGKDRGDYTINVPCMDEMS